ncbi:CDP-diacylglycerol--glycerol-3-phosphate 3-phosphatidyltransferase [Cyclonatronum proteinivorum]|uniref:CDP-diacylglycerol--glycerol-3-phosphate 3-phosphatidyltransferase n=1 Tax=Cyclonatronum proteinivorum TaxID=1457365 RepID=A0A345UNE2_9BACT|nr:CDP-alcohol phosphatidyltransferase family protein [Cyclonatronum proteinivorum]AXJ01994.1 CDP-diacylglycerol--glycerol-3-phosphate 3-phosphatidyltransferase [Cyclonatronum proteinivorum]
MTITPVTYLNLPNALSLSRLLGVPFLFWLLYAGELNTFLGLYVALGLTDFLDGKAARYLKQESEFGAHLDAAADFVFYLSSAWFFYVLFPHYLGPNMLYLQLLLGLFFSSIVLSLLKFRRVLFLHTWLSKLGGAAIFIAMIASFFMDTTLVFRAVILIYAIGFTEVILIYLIHGEVHPDIRSIFRPRF